jgi:hypothetical protein
MSMEQGKFANRMRDEGYAIERRFADGYAVHETHEPNGDYVATLLDAAGQSVEAVRVSASTLKFYDDHLGGAEQLQIERRKELEMLGEKMAAIQRAV